MQTFLHAHAMHPDWRIALSLAAAQLEAQAETQRHELGDRALAPTLGWVYLTDHYAAHTESLLAELRLRWPGVAWVGATGVVIGYCSTANERAASYTTIVVSSCREARKTPESVSALRIAVSRVWASG